MNSPYTFDVQVSQNEYLPAGGTTMDAVLSIECVFDKAAPVGPVGSVAQVIMIDCSTSMSGARFEQAKRATGVAIDTLRDGVEFAVVAGNQQGRVMYPELGRLATASNTTRAEARRTLRKLGASGGTTWMPARTL